MRVLVADDDEFIIEPLEAELRRRGYNTISAKNGWEACNLITDTKPDLVILDYNMPEMSGLEVLRIIKENDETRYTPVIMLTARKNIKDISDSLSAGIIDYIVKPFEIDELMKRVMEAKKRVEKGIVEIPKKSIAVHDPKILFVEKYQENQQLVRSSLEKLGYIVEIAETEEGAINALTQSNYFVVVIDSNDSSINGYDLCRRIRVYDKIKKTFRIIIGIGTESKNNNDKQWLNAGMNDYISKPVHINNVIDLIKKHQKEAIIKQNTPDGAS